ncbi:MAG: hypothetical protein ACPGUE_11225 [Marinomonas sp.]
MNNIDFSKAPEGATHYYKNDYFGVVFYMLKDGAWFHYLSESDFWVLSGNSKDWIDSTLIEITNHAIIECKTEREQMLCEQVLRVIRGEASQQLVNTYWKDVPPDNIINIDKLIRYRAKPKKELVVPWDILSDEVTEIKIDKHGNIYDGGTPLRIKLDLTDIELPITVKRPEEK